MHMDSEVLACSSENNQEIELHLFLITISFIQCALEGDDIWKSESIPLSVTEIPVASPTASYSSYEEPSGQ